MFQSIVSPKITKDYLERITWIFQAFKEIKFNEYGGMFAVYTYCSPVGDVDVSMLVDSLNVTVYRAGTGIELWTGYLYDLGIQINQKWDENSLIDAVDQKLD